MLEKMDSPQKGYLSLITCYSRRKLEILTTERFMALARYTGSWKKFNNYHSIKLLYIVSYKIFWNFLRDTIVSMFETNLEMHTEVTRHLS